MAASTQRDDSIAQEGTRGRILSVDDDLLSARGTARVLRRSGYAVDVATSTDQALALMAEERYDTIVTDLAMPGADGAALIVRGRALQPSVTFVVVTGCADANTRLATAPADSVLGILRKPWVPNDLVDLVRRAVEVGHRRTQPAPAAARLLLVEDSDAHAELISTYLSDCGMDFAVTHVLGLEEALEMLSREQFDLLLTDLNLPDARGLDAVRRFVGAVPDLPIISMSHSLDPAIGAQSLELGASDFLAKDDLTPALLRRSFEHAVLRRRARRQLEELAFRDALTGLSNARHLRDRLALAVARALRMRAACAMVFIDLDGFKPINDNYGHEAGDHVLQVVARRMDKELRSSDTLARIGGDEFALLLEDVASNTDVVTITERVIAAIASPIPWRTVTVRVSGSAGIALCPQCASSPEALLRAADAAMYRAKSRGHGGYEVAPQTRAKLE
jgi:diguanylate cyclase (GGDEF)-like protein